MGRAWRKGWQGTTGKRDVWSRGSVGKGEEHGERDVQDVQEVKCREGA